MENELMEQMNEYKKSYYDNNKKNVFFKKSQKMDCAQHITNQLDLPTLLSKTFYIIPNTTNVYFDYPLFKMYANDQIYDIVVVHIYNTIMECIQKNNVYTSHANIKGLTVTAVERYKILVEKFNQYCIMKNEYENMNHFLKNCYIYNSPSCINMVLPILKSLIEPSTFLKISLVDNKKSDEYLQQLLSTSV